MPFETYSYQLNQGLNGGIPDKGLHLVAGAPQSGLSTLVIDLAARYMRRPLSEGVVVISHDLGAWQAAIQAREIYSKIVLASTFPDVRGLDRGLKIVEAAIVGTIVYLGDSCFPVDAIHNANSCTIVVANVLQNVGQQWFQTVMEMKVQDHEHICRVVKSLAGKNGTYNLTRRMHSNGPTAIDMLLDDEDVV